MSSVPGKLYILATPIGNLADLSQRAVSTLASADALLAEDTRSARRLLSHLGLSKPAHSLFGENERAKIRPFLEMLERGRNLVLLSEAGTPAVSDPGQYLVREALLAGIPVVPVPGPSALTTALSVSGLPAVPSLFLGFLPKKSGKRKKLIERSAGAQATLVVFVGPHDAVEVVSDLLDILGDRPATLCRELTKMFEEVKAASLAELFDDLKARPQIRGEITLVIGPPLEPTRHPSRTP